VPKTNKNKCVVLLSCVSEVTSNKDQYYVGDVSLGSHSIASNNQKHSVTLPQNI